MSKFKVGDRVRVRKGQGCLGWFDEGDEAVVLEVGTLPTAANPMSKFRAMTGPRANTDIDNWYDYMFELVEVKTPPKLEDMTDEELGKAYREARAVSCRLARQILDRGYTVAVRGCAPVTHESFSDDLTISKTETVKKEI
jgi:hypothetical protein